MRNLIFSILMMGVVGVFSNVVAQRETPAGAGDKNLADNNVKMRSVELERVKREAAQAEAASFAPINTKLAAKFPQIKEDFEGIQMLMEAIINAYTTGKTINYSLIETAASGINSKGKRLDANLFADSKKEKVEVQSTNDVEMVKPVRDLIVELDRTIGSFVSSKIFGNIKIIEAEDAIKTRTDLLSILRLSEKLSAETKKLKQQ